MDRNREKVRRAEFRRLSERGPEEVHSRSRLIVLLHSRPFFSRGPLPILWTFAFPLPVRDKWHLRGRPCVPLLPLWPALAPAFPPSPPRMPSPTRRRLLPRGSRCSGSRRTSAHTSPATRVSIARTLRGDGRQSLCRIPQADTLPPEPPGRNVPHYSQECRSCRILLAPPQRPARNRFPAISLPGRNRPVLPPS